jgi:hypothetical protein
MDREPLYSRLSLVWMVILMIGIADQCVDVQLAVRGHSDSLMRVLHERWVSTAQPVNRIRSPR